MTPTTDLMRGERAHEVIAAIEYRRVTRRHLLVPHAVYTVRPEKPNWLATGYDFDWCAKAGIVCYHNSASGGEGLFLSAFSKPGKIGVPIWCNPALMQTRASPRVLKRWGYKLVSAPLGLFGTAEINPFLMGWSQEVKTEYCKGCRSFVPIESDDPCEHLTWDEEECGFVERRRSA